MHNSTGVRGCVQTQKLTHTHTGVLDISVSPLIYGKCDCQLHDPETVFHVRTHHTHTHTHTKPSGRPSLGGI